MISNEETMNKIKEIFEEDNPCAEIILPEPIRNRGIRVQAAVRHPGGDWQPVGERTEIQRG